MGLELIANHLNQYEVGVNQAMVLSEFNNRPAIFMNVQETSEKKARSFLERLGVVTSAYAEKAEPKYQGNSIIDMYYWDGAYAKIGNNFPGKNEWSKEISLSTWKDIFFRNKSIQNIFPSSELFYHVMEKLYREEDGTESISKVQITVDSIVFRILSKDKRFIKPSQKFLDRYGYSADSTIYMVWEKIGEENTQKILDMLKYY